MTKPQQLFSPYETNTSKPKNDRSSYTAEMFMADRNFSPHERKLAQKAADLCVRFRDHQRRYSGERVAYEGETAESLLAETGISQTRQVTIMCAAIRIATKWGEDFSKYAIRSNEGTYSNEDMLDALARMAEDLGRTPTSDDIRGDSDSPSRALYFRRFGSLREAQRRAGLEPNPPHRRAKSNGSQEAA